LGLEKAVSNLTAAFPNQTEYKDPKSKPAKEVKGSRSVSNLFNFEGSFCRRHFERNYRTPKKID
jgi:hypothetical protein